MTITESQSNFKRRRFTEVDPMESEALKAKFAALKEELGREITVFETSKPSVPPPKESSDEEMDDFYELTAADYFRIAATKKEDKFLKTRKIREAEEAARRSRITKTTIRVRFPDNVTLESTFHPSETFQSLVELLTKVTAHSELPFYLYTTPPKKQIKDLSQDFYSAGFIPGAIVYFSYDASKGDIPEAASSGPYLKEDILSLKDLVPITDPEPAKPENPTPEAVTSAPEPAAQVRKPADKKPAVPKWFKR
uniref:UBX domain-containing protein n=1 Tax=Kalanchoe fedtschenkoi TaxID=63787 RepID=A0A7N0V8U1_KALFE